MRCQHESQHKARNSRAVSSRPTGRDTLLRWLTERLLSYRVKAPPPPPSPHTPGLTLPGSSVQWCCELQQVMYRSSPTASRVDLEVCIGLCRGSFRYQEQSGLCSHFFTSKCPCGGLGFASAGIRCEVARAEGVHPRGHRPRWPWDQDCEGSAWS